MKTCRSFVIGYVLCGLVIVAVVVVWKESSYIAKTRLYLTVTQAVLEFLLICLYLLSAVTLYFLLIFLKDSVLCSPGWSQIPCSWRWPELLTFLISLLQCWVYGSEPLFLTCAQVHTCSIQMFFWVFKARSFTHKLHSYSLKELAVSVVLLWMVFSCNNFCLYKRDGLSTSYF